MHKLIAMFRLEPYVKLNDLWRVAYRKGYEKPRLVQRMGMYEMLWFVLWAIFTFNTAHSKVAFLGLVMLICGILFMCVGPVVSIMDVDSGRIRRMRRTEYRLYRQQMHNQKLWPSLAEVGISSTEKLVKIKK